MKNATAAERLDELDGMRRNETTAKEELSNKMPDEYRVFIADMNALDNNNFQNVKQIIKELK